MSNWRERAEQESLRLASEQEAARQAAGQTERDKEALIQEKLGVFDELGIRRTLAEIQRDIWRGQGTIDDEAAVGKQPEHIEIGLHASSFIRNKSGFGIRSARLLDYTWWAVATEEPNHKEVFGEYLVEGQTHVSMGEYSTDYIRRKGWHDVVDGSKIVGASILPRQIYLSSSLLYYGHYVLVVNGQVSEFLTPNIEKMTNFLDQAFLEYATKADIPDFAASRREAEMEAARIRSRIGEIVR